MMNMFQIWAPRGKVEEEYSDKIIIQISNSNPAQDVIEQIIHDIAVHIERHGDTTSFARKEMEI